MVRITDVARKAGVSPSTVSHALNGKRPISRETKERVHRAIEELGYSPNPNAQALKTRHSGTIGFFASNITELFVSRIIPGVERVTTAHGCVMVFASGVEFELDVPAALDFLRRRHLDGVIVSYAISERKVLQMLNDFAVPIVTINRRVGQQFCSVMPDDDRGGRNAATHLYERGVRVPAAITGPRQRFSSQRRIDGFKRQFRELGVEVPDSRIYEGDFAYGSGAAGVTTLLAEQPSIDGIFCANDFMAAGAINQLERSGRRVPGDVKVLGYDDRDFASFWPTPISTFTQPLEEMGRLSAEMLFDLIEGRAPSPRHRKVMGSLIERKSTNDQTRTSDGG